MSLYVFNASGKQVAVVPSEAWLADISSGSLYNSDLSEYVVDSRGKGYRFVNERAERCGYVNLP